MHATGLVSVFVVNIPLAPTKAITLVPENVQVSFSKEQNEGEVQLVGPGGAVGVGVGIAVVNVKSPDTA